MMSGSPSCLQELRLAEAHANAGRLADAEAVLRQILKAEPNQPDALNALAAIAANVGKLDIAIALEERAVAARPNAPLYRFNLAEMNRRAGRFAQALAQIDAVLAIKPDAIDAHIGRANLLQSLGRLRDAEAALRQALELAPDRADVANALGLVLSAAGRQQDALEFLRRAAIAGQHPDLWNNVGTALKTLGRFEEAIAAFDAALALDPRSAAALLGLSEVKTFRDASDPHLQQMEALGRDLPALPAEQRIYAHYALGKAFDDLGRARDAFAHFQAGAALKRSAIAYDEAAALGLFDRIKANFDAETAKRETSGVRDGAPIFIVGMPRSGTTLIEQIVSSHPNVSAAGEIPAMNEAMREAGYPESINALQREDLARIANDYLKRLKQYASGAWITDKTPSNMLYIGLLHLALPAAKIIHIRRDPVDTCLSCYTRLFTREMGHTYDLAELGRYYRAYHELMQHWRAVLPEGAFLDVRYEDVVADTESEARRVLEYCGWGWDDRVLDFYLNQRAVSTASAAQVRRPIYGTSVARWRQYQAHLGPLLDALGDLVEST